MSEDGSCALLSQSDESSSTAEFQVLVRSLEASSVEHLETASEIGTKFLHKLHLSLVASGKKSNEAQRWSKRTEEILLEKQDSGAVIAVLGGTGVGKSSMINAILDEQRLIPTNCVRACTACPIEISYNESNDPAQRYRAEIEFVSVAEWTAELDSLLGDIDSNSGAFAQAHTRMDPEAEVAWAKINAVYPGISKAEIPGYDSGELSEQPQVRDVLGTTKTLHTTSAALLYGQLREIVVSKGKTSAKKMELWPLVKTVRMFTKAQALTTGAVIVDLPGTGDTNAARAATAAQYLQKATSFWIVAPIVRAVNDKTAKDLLGDAFRRQVKLDGNFSAITFICSKTDGIDVAEARESLKIEAPMGFSWNDDARLEEEIKDLEEKQKLLKEKVKEHVRLRENADDNAEHHEALMKKIEEGQSIYLSSPDNPGEDREDSGNRMDFEQRLDPGSTSSEQSACGSVSEKRSETAEERSDMDHVETTSPNKLLTLQKAKELVNCYKLAKHHHREQKVAIESKLVKIGTDIDDLKAQLREFEVASQTLCIRSRNQYAIQEVKRDFAEGIKELDDEAALERDEGNFDPSQNIQDYDAISASLPVFCCSSNAYQKSRGKSRRDHDILNGFPKVDDTGIPALRDHLMQSTVPARRMRASQYLIKLARLVMSLRMWHADGGSLLTEKEEKARKNLLRLDMQILKKKLLAAVDEFDLELTRALHHHIYQAFKWIVPEASEAAAEKATSWGCPNDPCRMLYPTYRAVCLRDGVFRGRNGPRDLNHEMLEPVLRGIGARWEKVFTRLAPVALKNFSKTCVSELEMFRLKMLSRKDILNAARSRQKLDNLLFAYQESPASLRRQVTRKIRHLQRDANRSFYPVIKKRLHPAYRHCAGEKDKGAYRRMTDYMVAHVTETSKVTFEKSTKQVRTKLEDMCKEVATIMKVDIQGMVADITHDCQSALGGCGEENAKALKAQVLQFLTDFDNLFEDVLPMP